MRHLQEFYKKYKDQDLVILGLNCSDDKRIALDFMRENSATFPNILDSSDSAKKIAWSGYKQTAVPTSYIIDREGKVFDAFCGYEKGHKRITEILEKIGLKRENL
jgi:glutathione peroxidase-family protein